MTRIFSILLFLNLWVNILCVLSLSSRSYLIICASWNIQNLHEFNWSRKWKLRSYLRLCEIKSKTAYCWLHAYTICLVYIEMARYFSRRRIYFVNNNGQKAYFFRLCLSIRGQGWSVLATRFNHEIKLLSNQFSNQPSIIRLLLNAIMSNNL